MKKRIATTITALCLACASYSAQAQSDASAVSAISLLPMASIVVEGSAVAASVVAIPVALSTAGAVLLVKTVESTARGTIFVLQRVSDGARVSVEIIGKGVAAASMAAGAVVTVSVVGAGVVLSVAGEAIAFVANDLGRALLHNEQLTY